MFTAASRWWNGSNQRLSWSVWLPDVGKRLFEVDQALRPTSVGSNYDKIFGTVLLVRRLSIKACRVVASYSNKSGFFSPPLPLRCSLFWFSLTHSLMINLFLSLSLFLTLQRKILTCSSPLSFSCAQAIQVPIALSATIGNVILSSGHVDFALGQCSTTMSSFEYRSKEDTLDNSILAWHARVLLSFFSSSCHYVLSLQNFPACFLILYDA